MVHKMRRLPYVHVQCPTTLKAKRHVCIYNNTKQVIVINTIRSRYLFIRDQCCDRNVERSNTSTYPPIADTSGKWPKKKRSTLVGIPLEHHQQNNRQHSTAQAAQQPPSLT